MSFAPGEPFRFVDSRLGLRSRPMRANVVQRIQISGVAGVPPDLTAISANFTVVNQDRQGYLTAYDCTSSIPTVSTLNFVPGQAVANQAIIPLDDRGGLCLFTPANADIVIDVNGSFGADASGRLTSLTPFRAHDSRTSSAQPLRAGETRRIRIESRASGVPASATAAVVNLTAVRPARSGWVRAIPCDQRTTPTVSNLNAAADQVIANSAIVKLSTSGEICLQTNTTTDVIVDVTGYLSSTGMQFQAVEPVRLLDSRGGGRALDARMPAGDQSSIRVAGVGGLPSDARAVSANLIAVLPTGPGFVTAWPCARAGESPPTASNLNHPTGRNVANGATVGLTEQGLCVYHRASTHLVIDVTGIWR